MSHGLLKIAIKAEANSRASLIKNIAAEEEIGFAFRWSWLNSHFKGTR